MDEIAKALEALADPNWDWRTVEGVSKETQIPEDRVLEIIEAHTDEIIRSRIPDSKGRALYTTRDHYRKRRSPIMKIMDQIKHTSS